MRDALAALDIDALWQRALAHLDDGDDRVEYLVELHERGTREIFDRAIASCSAAGEDERLLAVLTLRELGGPPPRFAAEAVPHLLAALGREPSARVRRWIISAIGYQHMTGHEGPRLSPTQEVLATVLRFASGDAPLVRFAVAAALPSLVDLDAPEPEAIEVLLRLSDDLEADTRYYALAALIDDLRCSSADVRAALERRIDDLDPQIVRAARRVLYESGTWAE